MNIVMNDEFPLIKTVYLFLLKKCLFVFNKK